MLCDALRRNHINRAPLHTSSSSSTAHYECAVERRRKWMHWLQTFSRLAGGINYSDVFPHWNWDRCGAAAQGASCVEYEVLYFYCDIDWMWRNWNTCIFINHLMECTQNEEKKNETWNIGAKRQAGSGRRHRKRERVKRKKLNDENSIVWMMLGLVQWRDFCVCVSLAFVVVTLKKKKSAP